MFDTTGLFLLTGSYLAGSIPFGLLLTRWAGHGDVRRQGSGNIGATNVLRTAGKTLGALTLVCDALKGAIPVVAAEVLRPDWVVWCGLLAFLGHLFPLWLRFRGGKGVATALGVMLAAVPAAGGMACLVWLIMAKVFRISSLAALVAMGSLPLWVWLMQGTPDLVLLGSVIAGAVIIRHHSNIRRLWAGTEPKIGPT